MAVIPVGKLHDAVDSPNGVEFKCVHVPRDAEILADDKDPHSEVTTAPTIPEWPADGAWRLMVQQFICDQVVHHEVAGKLEPTEI